MKKLSIILVCFFSLIIIIYTVHFYHQLYQCKFHTEQIDNLIEEDSVKQNLKDSLNVKYYETKNN